LKISFGAPKPVGFTSECEQFDAYFETAPSSEDIARLDPLLPPGFKIVSAAQSLTKDLSILEATRSATYIVGLRRADLKSALAAALSQGKLMYTRRSKKRERQVDLRPGVFEAELLHQSDKDYASFFKYVSLSAGERGRYQLLKLTLALTDTSSVRPEEFLSVAGILSREGMAQARIHRLRFGCETLRPLPTERRQTSDVSGS